MRGSSGPGPVHGSGPSSSRHSWNHRRMQTSSRTLTLVQRGKILLSRCLRNVHGRHKHRLLVPAFPSGLFDDRAKSQLPYVPMKLPPYVAWALRVISSRSLTRNLLKQGQSCVMTESCCTLLVAPGDLKNRGLAC